jgi:hypothetical protein
MDYSQQAQNFSSLAAPATASSHDKYSQYQRPPRPPVAQSAYHHRHRTPCKWGTNCRSLARICESSFQARDTDHCSRFSHRNCIKNDGTTDVANYQQLQTFPVNDDEYTDDVVDGN